MFYQDLKVNVILDPEWTSTFKTFSLGFTCSHKQKIWLEIRENDADSRQVLKQLGHPVQLHSKTDIELTMHHTPYTKPTPYTMHQNAIHHVTYTIRQTLFAMHHTPNTIRHTPYRIRHTPYRIRHTPYRIRYTPYTIRHMPYTIHHMPYAQFYHTSYTICHTQYAIFNTPHDICDTKYSIHHT